MQPADPEWKAIAHHTFSAAPFVEHLGVALGTLAPGHCTSTLPLRPEHLQQDGVAHAGVLTTLLDHTAGTAAATLMPPGLRLVSIEFKVHLLRGATGPTLHCEAAVVKPGRAFSVVEATARQGDKAVAKLLGTMAYVEPRG